MGLAHTTKPRRLRPMRPPTPNPADAEMSGNDELRQLVADAWAKEVLTTGYYPITVDPTITVNPWQSKTWEEKQVVIAKHLYVRGDITIERLEEMLDHAFGIPGGTK